LNKLFVLLFRLIFKNRYSYRVPACIAGVWQGAFTCVGWQVTLCDPIWQVMSRSSDMGFPDRAISAFTFLPS